jgi:hypothetical protein
MGVAALARLRKVGLVMVFQALAVLCVVMESFLSQKNVMMET